MTDFSTPTIDLLVDGKQVPDEVRRDITAVRFKSTVFEMDSMELTFANPPITPDVSVAFQEMFKKQKTHLALFLGYSGNNHFVGGVVVQEMEALYRDSKIIIRGRDGGSLMALGTKGPQDSLSAAIGENTEQFMRSKEDGGDGGLMEDHEIARKIAETNGFTVLNTIGLFPEEFVEDISLEDSAGASSLIGDGRVRSRESQYEFMNRIAAENGFLFYIDMDQDDYQSWRLHFHSDGFHDQQQQSKVFTWNEGDTSTILQMNPFSAFDELDTKQGFIRLAGMEAMEGVPYDLIVQTLAPVQRIIRDPIGIVSEEHASRFLRALAKDADKAFLTSGMLVIGDPELRAGQIHEIRGLDSKYVKNLDGFYRFVRVEHLIDDNFGYSTRCQTERILSQDQKPIEDIAYDSARSGDTRKVPITDPMIPL